MREGYVSLTDICRKHGRPIWEYFPLSTYKALIQDLSHRTGLSSDELVIKVMTGKNEERGTWGHPEVAKDLEAWATRKPRTKFIRDEKVFTLRLATIFQGVAEFSTQYPIEGYFLDIFFPAHKLAVEYDEAHHKRHSLRDFYRQEIISRALDCHFIRVRQGLEDQGINAILRYIINK